MRQAHSTYIKIKNEKQRSYSSNLAAYLKALEQREETTTKWSSCQEIIKLKLKSIK